MKFLALLRKELRECLPWILLAAIVLFVIDGLILRGSIVYQQDRIYERLSPGAIVDYYRLTRYPALNETGPLLFFSSIGLGLILGVRQFWMPHFTGTWQFLLHRSAGRKPILAAKLAAATIGFIISLGALWCCFYWYACRPEVFRVSPPFRVFVEGWLFIMLGLVVYLGTALSGLSTAKWYTTKIFGLAFLLIILVMFSIQYKLAWAFTVIIIGSLILLVQIFDLFLKREF